MLLSSERVAALMKKYDIPTPKTVLAEDEKELPRVLKGFRYPVALKISSPDIVHKSDVGGVILNIRSVPEAIDAFKKFQTISKKRKARFAGALVQEQVEGKYVLVGLKRDPQFGPVVAFGLGGIFVEILKDVTFRICPVTDEDIAEMMTEIKGYPILTGVRGEKGVNLAAIHRVIKNVSELALTEDIKELDINPLVVSPAGAWAVDVRVIT